MQHDQATDVSWHERFVRHPIHATVEEAARVGRVADEGKSPATPAILVGAVLAFVVPLATIVILLAFGIAHFSS